MAAGEASPDAWEAALRREVPGVTFVVEPAFGYFDEQSDPPAVLRRAIRAGLARMLRGAGEVTLWFQNPGLCRNPLLNDEVRRACGRSGVRVLAHHHDFWFDNRWARLAGLRAAGFRSTSAWSRTTFLDGARVAQAVINSHDHRLAQAAGWSVRRVPNPVMAAPPRRDAVRHAREWLRQHAGAVAWICPGRLLRRKNVLEAVLLARVCEPRATLVLAADASSADEQAYARAVRDAARAERWPVWWIDFAANGAPPMAALTAAADAILLTSLTEGFGLAYLEAATLGRPLLARRLPVVTGDLRPFGFRGATLYGDVAVPQGLFSLAEESARQAKLWKAAAHRIPARWRRELPQPVVRDRMPFRCLSLEGQLAVLAHPDLADAILAANPWMRRLRGAGPRPAEWHQSARDLSPRAAARRIVAAMASSTPTVAGDLDGLVRAALSASPFYPLLAGPLSR